MQKASFRPRERGRPKDPNTQQINENTESFRNFIRRFRNSPITKKDYTAWFRRFLDYCNLPETRSRIKVHIDDNPDLLLFNNDTKRIQNVIKSYIDYQYEVRKLSPVTVRGHYMAIKHFYESNEIILNWSVIKKDYVGITSNMKSAIDMPYTYEEIHKMLDKSDERKRVVILLLASTGMRRGAIAEIRYGDLKWIEKYQIYEIKVYSGFKDEYITYCSAECAAALNSYLDFRRRYGEKITKDSYLIRKQFDTRPTSNISNASDPPELHKLSDWEIQHMLYKLVYDSGIRSLEDKKTRLGERHQNMLSHAFRKFFENKCLEAGIDPFFVSVLMGHKSAIGVEMHYYRPTSINGENSLLELYSKKAIPFLTINEENRLRLKNRELEMLMNEDNRRIKEAEATMREALEKSLKERDKSNYDVIAALVIKLMK